MYRNLVFFLLLLTFALTSLGTSAQHQRDTIEIQAFTFYNARDSMIVFPSDTNRYEKILMYYTLKCDPRQNPACGEWDYLTYTNLFYPSGKMDSTEFKQPWVVWNGDGRDTARFRRTAYWQYNPRMEYFFNRTASIAKDSSILGSGASVKPISPLANNIRQQKSQLLLRGNELINAGLNQGAITGMRLNLSANQISARELKISMAHTMDSQLSEFLDPTMKEVYQRSYSNPIGSWSRIEFTDSFVWNGNSNILVQISYDNWSSPNITSQPNCSSDSTNFKSFATASSNSRYFKLDGQNDYIDAGAMSFLDSTTSYTIEGWIKVDNWKSWVKPFGKGSPLGFELGSNVGDLFTMVRTSGNTYGSAPGVLTEGKWHHIATVFDGTASTNSNRLKLFIDGQKVTLNFNGTIPAKTPVSTDHFSFGGWNGSQAFDGCQNNSRIWASALHDSLIGEWFDKTDLAAHPELSELKAHYLGENSKAFELTDASSAGNDAKLVNGTKSYNYDAAFDLSPLVSNWRPQLILDQDIFTGMLDSLYSIDSVLVQADQILIYGDSLNPRTATDTFLAWPVIWVHTKFDAMGLPVDSVFYGLDTLIYGGEHTYYGDPFEIQRKIEIGRFITPYGNGLDLGPGFTWVYDLTDYAPILKDTLRLTAGNWQELLDLKFQFIKGVPARDAVSVDFVWGERRSYRFKDLASDAQLSEVEVQLDPMASQYKIKSRITGHGHNGANGQPHCCEWKDNGHYMYVDGALQFAWSIWQTDDCSTNPVYPQGGTWPHARAGWCPGASVPEYEFELTPFVSAGSMVKLDYDIDPVPANNPKQGNGNYQMAHHLIAYTDPNFANDVSVSDIISPNTNDLYGRFNPICGKPIIEIQNTGNNTLTSLRISYGPVGGTKKTITHRTGLAFLEKEKITLDPIDWSNWNGIEEFEVIVDQPNGAQDEYLPNNTMTVPFEKTPELPTDFVVWLKSNLAPQETVYSLTDVAGNVVYTKRIVLANKAYQDTLKLAPGCYKFHIEDSDGDGISYWANNDGNGSCRFWKLHGGGFLKTFEPDFGKSISFSFTAGYTVNVEPELMTEYSRVYPNPSEGLFNLHLQYNSEKSVCIELFDANGRLIESRERQLVSTSEQFDLTRHNEGIYYLKINTGEGQKVHKLVYIK